MNLEIENPCSLWTGIPETAGWASVSFLTDPSIPACEAAHGGAAGKR